MTLIKCETFNLISVDKYLKKNITIYNMSVYCTSEESLHCTRILTQLIRITNLSHIDKRQWHVGISCRPTPNKMDINMIYLKRILLIMALSINMLNVRNSVFMIFTIPLKLGGDRDMHEIRKKKEERQKKHKTTPKI